MHFKFLTAKKRKKKHTLGTAKKETYQQKKKKIEISVLKFLYT